MPSVSITIDSRGAAAGAETCVRSFDAISAAAKRTAEVVASTEAVLAKIAQVQSGSGVAAQLAGVQKIGAAERQLAADRARADREATRRDAEAIRSQQQLERQLLTLRSTFGGAERGAAQYARGLATLDATLARGIINQAEYNRLLAILRERTTTASVNSRDLRLNMQSLALAAQGVAANFGVFIPQLSLLTAGATSVAKSFESGVITLGALAAGASIGVGALALFTAGAVKAAGTLAEISHTAQSVGISVGKLQELRFIGLVEGVENIDTALIRLADRLGKTEQGAQILSPALRSLGLDFAQLANLDRVDALKLIADRFKAIQDPTVQAAIAIELFGRGGIRMANILKLGSAGIDEMRAQAHALGAVMSDETVDAGKKLHDNLQVLEAGLKALTIRALGPTIESLKDFTTWLITSASAASKLQLQTVAGFSLEQTRAEIEKTKADIEKLRNAGLNSDALGDHLKALQTHLSLIPGAAKEMGDSITDAGQKSIDSIEETIQKVKDLRAQVSAFRSSGAGGLSATQAVQEAQKLIAGMNSSELQAQAEKTNAVSASRLDVVAATARWILEEKKLNAQLSESKKGVTDSTKDAEKLALARQKQADADQVAAQNSAIAISDQIGGLNDQATALQGEAEARAQGTDALEAYQRAQFVSTELEKAEATARKGNIDLLDEERAAVVAAAGAKFDAAQANADIQKAQADAVRVSEQESKAIFEPFKEAMRNIQNSLAGSIKAGLDGGKHWVKDFAKSMVDTLKTAFSQIASSFILGSITGANGSGGLLDKLKQMIGGGTPATDNLAKQAVENQDSQSGPLTSALSGLGKSIGSLNTWLSGTTSDAGPTQPNFLQNSLANLGGDAGVLGGIAKLAVSAAAGIFAGLQFQQNNVNTALAQQIGGAANLVGSVLGTIGGLIGSLFTGISSLGAIGGALGGFLGAKVDRFLVNASTKQKAIAGVFDFLLGGPLLSTTGILGKGTATARLLTAAPGTDPNRFENQTFATSPFGLVGANASGTSQLQHKQTQAIADYVANLDTLIAKELTDAQFTKVKAAVLAQGNDALRVRGTVLDNEIVRLVKDRLQAAFGSIFDSEGVTKFLGTLPNKIKDINKVVEGAVAFLKERASIVKEMEDALGAQNISAAAQSIKDLNAHFDDLRDRAKNLAFSEADLAKLEAARAASLQTLKTGFAQSIEDQILAITDPGKLAFRELERQQSDRLKSAIDFGADLVKIEELTQLERKKLSDEQLQSIKALRNEMLTGSTSSLSPLARLGNAQTAFDAQKALVLGGNLGAADTFAQAAATLRDISREVFASGPMFAQFETFLMTTLNNILGSAPGFATEGVASAGSDSRLIRIQPQETATITHGPPPDPRPDLQELGRVTVKGNAEQAGLLRSLVAKVEELKADNQELHAKLNRVLNEKRVA